MPQRIAIVERGEIGVTQGRESHPAAYIAHIRPVHLLEISEHIGNFGLQVGSFFDQQERRDRTAVAHTLVVGRVDVAETFGTHDDIHAGNHRAVDVPHHAAHHVGLLLVGEADRLPHRVERPESLAGERLGENDVFARSERLRAVALQKFEIKHAEEGRIGEKHGSRVFLLPDFDGLRGVGRLSRHGDGTGRFDFGIAVAQVFLQVIAAAQTLLGANDTNAVAFRVVIIAGELPQGVVGNQDHEHQRDRETENVDRRIESVAAQKVEERTEVELPEHILFLFYRV